MGENLGESVVRVVAASAASRITRQVIAELQKITSVLLVRADSRMLRLGTLYSISSGVSPATGRSRSTPASSGISALRSWSR